MKNSFRSSLLALSISLALVVPTYAQSTDITSPQNDSVQNDTAQKTIFLPLVSSTASQTEVTDVSDEAPLAEVQASAVVASNGKLAFSSTMDGDADIYTMNPDGSGLVNLTNNIPGPHQTEPNWSPDGTKIAFTMGGSLNSFGVTQGYIMVMNADGSNAIFLTISNNGGGTDYQPKWSPDGTKIAFTTRREIDFDIYIMNADGSNPHNMFMSEPSGFGQPNEYDPSWSPDGAKLLYISVGSLMSTNMATLDAAGVGPQQVLVTSIGVEFSEPEWSPDGKLITYNRYGSTPELWVMNADGTNKSKITLANVANLQAPDFAPDGKSLTVIGQPAGVTGASKELFTLPAPTAPLTAPTTTTATAMRLTTIGGVGSADWQRKLVTVYPLSASVSGSGVVTSQPSGINCGTKCSADFVAGTIVTLTATPSAGSRFSNWSGACTTKSTTCTVTMSQARSVVANFRRR